jgi:hypothetical protein
MSNFFIIHLIAFFFFLLSDPFFRLILFFNFIIQYWIDRELGFIMFFDVMISVLWPKLWIWNVNPDCHWVVLIYIYLLLHRFCHSFIRDSTSSSSSFLSMRIVQLYDPCRSCHANSDWFRAFISFYFNFKFNLHSLSVFFFFALDPFLKLILFFFLILLFNIRLLKFEFHNFFLCGDSGLIIQVECIKC